MANEDRNMPVPMRPTGQQRSLTMGNMTADLSSLPEEEQRALMSVHARGIIDINKKSNELHVESENLKTNLGNIADNLGQMSEKGLSGTTTYTQNVQGGRIEMIAGNTDKAKEGKLSRSQTGEKDWTPYYIFAGLVALVLIAIVLAGHK